MKKVAAIVAGALLFGCVAGGTMVGVNVAAQRAGLTTAAVQQLPQKNTASGNASAAETKPAETQPATLPANNSTSNSGTKAEAGTNANVAGTNSISAVAKNAMPSVVAITNMVKYRQNGFSIFGDYQSRETEVPASGSGVIIGKNDTELLIVTNNHVVADSSSLSVTFVDDKTINAEIKGTDASSDLAIVAVKLSDIPAETMNQLKIATLGDSEALEVGDRVVAIGNALGYGQSVTTGIISAKNRDIPTQNGTKKALLQTDAAINPGNSGGALLNMQGEVIGINVAKYSYTSVEGMGYSIPSSTAKSVIDNLSALTTREKVSEAERGYLGVQVKTIDKQTAQSFNMPQGVFIYKLTEGSTAQNSGLQPKDIITAVDGQGVTSYDDLASLLSKYKAGETVKVTVQRPNGANYDEVVVDVVLGSSKSSNTNTPQQSSGNSGDSGSSPFDRPQNGSENNPSENPNGNSGSYDNEELWKQFEKFFNQYQR